MEKWVVKRYVYMLEPSDRVELNDDDVGSSDDRALDCLADREFLAAALLCLKPREERLIRLRYGIGGIGEHTYREIGNELGTTVEHARQIHLKSLRKLRWHAKRFDPARMAKAQPQYTVPPFPHSPALEQTAKRRSRTPCVPSRQRAPERSSSDFEARPTAQRRASPLARKREIAPDVRPRRNSRFSEWMLFWLAGCYLIALAFDSTLAFNLAKVAGGGSALLLHFIAAYVGLMINALVIFEIENSRDWPCSPMSQPWLTRIFGVLIVLAVVGVLGPSKQFFRGMIAETPDRFRSPTPTIILVFSAAILLIGPRCLVGIWKQGRSA